MESKMHYSRLIKSSQHCQVSPNGQLVATIDSSIIRIRSTRSLRSVNSIKLPSDVSSPVLHLLWSPSSETILVETAELIVVFSVTDSRSRATITNPIPGHAKPAHIQFGSTDSEILIFAPFGLKLILFNLSTLKAVEIPSPKFHLPGSAKRGFSLRSKTNHLALLTRVAGKDLVSIYHPVTRQLERSWSPDTLDGQAIVWSPDGSWLLLWDSPAQGRRLLLYSSDGQLYRSLGGADDPNDEEARLKLGIRLCCFSSDSKLCAICDHTREVTILQTQAWRVAATVVHPSSIVPSDTLQVWQEQRQAAAGNTPFNPSFVKASHEVSPLSAPGDTKSKSDLNIGCSVASFDTSGTLLATRLDEHPGTVWIWDLLAGELRAVLMFHSSADIIWHPSIRELLLVTCSHEDGNLHFLWDPLSNGPGFVNFEGQLPDGRAKGKVKASWIDSKDEDPALILTDKQHFCLLSLSDADTGPANWQEEGESFIRGTGSARQPLSSIRDQADSIYNESLAEDDGSMLEDTFSFKLG